LVACLASAIRASNATAQCAVGEFTRQAEAQRKAMEAQDEFTLGAIVKMHEKLYSQLNSKELMEFVRSNGLMPFLQDRQSMVNMEIEVDDAQPRMRSHGSDQLHPVAVRARTRRART